MSPKLRYYPCWSPAACSEICTCRSQNKISGRVITASVIRWKLSPLWTHSPSCLPVSCEDIWQLRYRERQTARSGEQSVGKLSQHSGRRAGASWWLPQHDRWDKHTTYTKSLTKERRFFHQLWHVPAPRDSQMLVVYLWLEERIIMPDVGTLSCPHWDPLV